jgi:putative PIN family toxin of toxin-antitoxin system
VTSVVLDTNVICSGLITPNGVPGKILRNWYDGQFELITSESILDELRRILGYPKIRDRLPLTNALLDEIFDLLEDAVISELSPLIVEDLTDQTDLIFIEAAAASEADYLVTGDRALLRLDSYGVTEIITPRRFLTILEEDVAT